MSQLLGRRHQCSEEPHPSMPVPLTDTVEGPASLPALRTMGNKMRVLGTEKHPLLVFRKAERVTQWSRDIVLTSTE